MKSSNYFKVDFCKKKSTAQEISRLKLVLHEILLETDLFFMYKTICNYLYLLSKFLKAFTTLTSWMFTINIFIPNRRRALGIELLSVAKPQLQNPTLSSAGASRTTSLLSVPRNVNSQEVMGSKCLFV